MIWSQEAMLFLISYWALIPAPPKRHTKMYAFSRKSEQSLLEGEDSQLQCGIIGVVVVI